MALVILTQEHVDVPGPKVHAQVHTTYKLHDGGEGVVEVVGGHGEVNWSLKTGCREAETGIHIGSPQSQLNFGLDKNSQEVVKEEKTRQDNEGDRDGDDDDDDEDDDGNNNNTRRHTRVTYTSPSALLPLLLVILIKSLLPVHCPPLQYSLSLS